MTLNIIWVANQHEIKVPQVAKIKLTDEEIRRLEETADEANVRIMGADVFRPFVLMVEIILSGKSV